MKKVLRHICGWGVALLLGSTASSCSAAHKAARGASSEETKDEVAPVQLDTVLKRKDPGIIRVLYGVPDRQYRKIENE